MRKSIKKMIFVLPLLLSILYGCVKESSNLPKNESIPNEMKEELTFSFDSKEHRVPIDKIPSLNDYLSQYTSVERKQEIERIIVTPFNSEKNGVFADVGYSCGTKTCNHVLIQVENDDIRTFILDQVSIFQRAIFSDDEKYLAILFGRNEGNELVRNILYIVDIEKLERIQINNSNEVINQRISVDSYIWPITEFKWLDNRTVELSVADINDSSYESVAKWFKENGPVKKIKLEITQDPTDRDDIG
ncbi:hypothetical protein [Brevibacillus reuszeri]|uniref:hypothetical protein n=1 Tax=Brevibacillus reuszeri TaxID=54915 RepID=UPI003D2573FC